MKSKYKFLIVVLVMLGIYYIFGINKYIDYWITLLLLKIRGQNLRVYL